MVHGIINVYKEKGYTSHDVVAKLRGIVGQKKIGHTGTLDPDATGVLPVCLGKATKVCDMLTDKDKVYEAVLLLGMETDTQDVTGSVIQTLSDFVYDEEEVRACILGFIGEYMQVPPMYSALKVNGKKLYELAREGVEVERQARRVLIHDIQILEMRFPKVRMRISCSKGTYIRTLCHDIGQKLGCGGCMEELVRTKVGAFQIEDAMKLEEIERWKKEERLKDCLIPVDAMFSMYRKVNLSPEGDMLVFNGNPFFTSHIRETDTWQDEEQVRVYDSNGRFLAVYCYKKSEKRFRVRKMFYSKEEE